MNGEYAISVKGLVKNYEGFCLDHVELAVPTGSIVGFIGENGAGKSTTIKAILGLIFPDAGTISVLGQENSRQTKEQREAIGAVFEESYFPDNMAIPAIHNMLKKIYKSWEEEVFLSYIKRFALPENKPVKEFSRGMKMKLAIAAALSHKTKLLIFDEATSGLDPIVRNEILDILLEFIQEEDHTIFLSSHITGDIERIADYIVFIHKGKILFSENKDELLFHYGVVCCNQEQYEQIDRDLIVGVQKNRFEYQVMVKEKQKIMEAHPDWVVDPATIEEIMLYVIKGEQA